MGGSSGHVGSWEAGIGQGGVTGLVSALLVGICMHSVRGGCGVLAMVTGLCGDHQVGCNLLVVMEPDKSAREVKVDGYQGGCRSGPAAAERSWPGAVLRACRATRDTGDPGIAAAETAWPQALTERREEPGPGHPHASHFTESQNF